jgi:hypothetical protein
MLLELLRVCARECRAPEKLLRDFCRRLKPARSHKETAETLA